MVTPNKEFDEMIDPIEQEEPDFGRGEFEPPENIWMRGLMMLLMGFLMELAKTVLAVVAVVQFLWMLFAKEKNRLLSDFGVDLGDWMARNARFLTGASDQKPFPFSKWGEE